MAARGEIIRFCAGIVFLALAAPALAYDVSGTVKARVRWAVDQYPGPIYSEHHDKEYGWRSQVTFYKKFEVYEVTYEAKAAPNGKWQVDTFIDYEWYEEYRSLTEQWAICVSNMGKNRDRKTSTVTNFRKARAKYTGPGQSFTFNEYPHQILELRMASASSEAGKDTPNGLEAHFSLSGVRGARFQEDWQESGQEGRDPCGKDLTVPTSHTDIKRSYGPSSEHIGFVVPGLVKLPLTDPTRIRFDYKPEAVRDLYAGKIGAVLEYLTADLTIDGLPVPVAKISDMAPERAAPVTFDASQSKGEFTEAKWVVKYDNVACEAPTVHTTDGPQGGLAFSSMSSSSMTSYFKNRSLPSEAAEIIVRKPGEPDRLMHATPLLCPVTAQLFLKDEKIGITVASEELKIAVKPRGGWRTTIKNIPAGAVSSVAGVPGEPPLSLGDYLNAKTAAGLNVPAFCIAGATYYRSDACRREAFSEHGWKKVIDASEVAAVANPYGGPPVTAPLGDGPSAAIKIAKSDGPFSDMYYFERVSDDLFARSYLYNPNIKMNAPFKECVDLHEGLHTAFLNVNYEKARARAGGAGPASGYFAKGVYDPKQLLEQMFDNSLLELLSRAATVIVNAGFLADSSDQDHTFMENWEGWVSDPATISKIRAMKEARREPGLITHDGLRNLSCGGANFPLANP